MGRDNNHSASTTNFLDPVSKRHNNTDRIYNFLKTKLIKRKYNKRPIELKTLHIAKGTKNTYSITRRYIEKMVNDGIIEKWTVNLGGPQPKRICRYRWKSVALKNSPL